MIAWLVGLALAGNLQEIHQLEWQRSEPMTIAARAAAAPVGERIDAALALGRLHSETALPVLAGMIEDPDPEVRGAVADALGWTPGSADTLRTWLDAMPRPRGAAARAAAVRGPRARAIAALGRAGDASDLPRLIELLEEPWPTSAAAADALGRMGRRKVEGGAAAVPALIEALERPDPRTRIAAAYAIRRLGLDGVDREAVSALAEHALAQADGDARAWLFQAVYPRLEGEARGDLFVRAVTDPASVVQVAALDAVGPGDVPLEIVQPWLSAPDPWVHQATIAALGRIGARDALQAFADAGPEPWDLALAIASVGDPLGVDWTDTGRAAVVRGAALAASGADADALIAVTLDVELPSALRTSAAGALLERDAPQAAWGERMLASQDVVVREAALELLGSAEPKECARILLPHVRVEKDLELLGTALGLLATAAGADKKAIAPNDPHASSAIHRAARSDTARVRAAATRLANALGLPAPTSPEDDDARKRELVLPSGKVVEVERGWPPIDEVRRIRSARVQTARGEFVIALDPDTAPLAVANFARLAEIGFFDGVVFHRVVPGFVAQTGCPRGDGWGSPGWTLPDEVSSLPYDPGSVGMARSTDWDTGGSQWFVSTAPTPHLVGDYTRFGEVVQGMAVVRSLRRGDVVTSVVIERIDP